MGSGLRCIPARLESVPSSERLRIGELDSRKAPRAQGGTRWLITGPSVSAFAPEHGGGRRTTFGCCHNTTSDGVAGFPCGSIMRRHPVIVTVILGLMALICLVMATGMIVGILRCLRAA